MSSWAPEQIEAMTHEQDMISAAFEKMFDLYMDVENHINALHPADAAGHIFWNEFKELIEEHEPRLKSKPFDLTDDLPF